MWRKLKKVNRNNQLDIFDEDFEDLFAPGGDGKEELPADPPADPATPLDPPEPPEPAAVVAGATVPADSTAPATIPVEPVVDPATPATPATATPDDPLTTLRNQLEELSTKLAQAQAVSSVKPTEAATPPTPQAGKDTRETQDFLGDLDIDEVVSKPELFNQVLNSAVSAAIGPMMEQLHALVTALPTLVQPAIRQTISMEKSIDQFYQAHPVLANFKQVVGLVANDLQTANPQATLDSILPQIADMAYAKLNLPAQAPTGSVNTPVTPVVTAQSTALPRTASSRNAPATVKTSKIEQEINDLFS
jgi:hypothetical protein